MYLSDEFIAHHVEKVLHESQLEYFLVDYGENQLQIILYLPFQDAITEIVLSLRRLLSEQYILDEGIKDVKFHLAEGAVPEDDTPCGKYASVFEHYI